MQKTTAMIERQPSINGGIPKYLLNALKITAKKNAVAKAPKLSIKKMVFGFCVNLFTIPFIV